MTENIVYGNNEEEWGKTEISFGLESTYWRRECSCLIGELEIPGEVVVDVHFGTDSIIMQQKKFRSGDERKALEILADAAKGDYGTLLDEDNRFVANALMHADKGPITGFSELFQSKNLSDKTILGLENSLATPEVLMGIDGKPGYWYKRWKGIRGEGCLREGLKFTYIYKNFFSDLELHGRIADDEEEINNLWEISLSPSNRRFSFSNSYLTGVTNKRDALDFINASERILPRKRCERFCRKVHELTEGQISIVGTDLQISSGRQKLPDGE